MRQTPCRPFTPIDAGILAGATGAWLAIVWPRQAVGTPAFWQRRIMTRPYDVTYLHGTTARIRSQSIGELPGVLFLFALFLSLAFLAIRLRRPRPTLRRIMTQPGSVAALTAIVVGVGSFLCEGARLGVRFAMTGKPPTSFSWWKECSLASEHVGLVVAATWIILAMARRWRREPGWIDGIGILIGSLWLMVSLVFLLSNQLFTFVVRD